MRSFFYAAQICADNIACLRHEEGRWTEHEHGHYPA